MQNEYTRFINKVQKTDDCWKWTGTTYRGGYGHFRRFVDGEWKMYKAHRYSYEVHHGPIPKDHLILHSCDNPSCVNPDHLRAGTHKENVADCIKRGRKRFGINPTNRSHRELVNEIRQYKQENPEASGVAIAKHFDTNTAQVSRILSRKIWSNPEEV